MKKKINFAKWPDAMLEANEPFADDSPSGLGLLAEIARRKKKGTWLADGSKERVEKFKKRINKR